MDLDSSSLASSSVSLASDGLSDALLVTKAPAVVPTISIPASVLKALASWASADATRPGLNAVRVDGNTLVATDGHRLLKVTLLARKPLTGKRGEDALPSSHVLASDFADIKHAVYSIPREVALHACKAAGASGRVEIKRGALGGGEIIIRPKSGHTSVLQFVPTDAPFPPYEQVIPSLKAFTTTHGDTGKQCSYVSVHALNPIYLAAIADVCIAFDGKDRCRHHGVQIAQCEDPMSPIVYTYSAKDDTDVVFVIMPMRI